MTSTWYCETCEESIEKKAIDDHEADGHQVRGFVRPDRLLSNDPWTLGDGDLPPNARPTKVESGGQHTDGDEEVRD